MSFRVGVKFLAQVLNGRFMDTGSDMVYEHGIVGSVALTQLAQLVTFVCPRLSCEI